MFSYNDAQWPCRRSLLNPRAAAAASVPHYTPPRAARARSRSRTPPIPQPPPSHTGTFNAPGASPIPRGMYSGQFNNGQLNAATAAAAEGAASGAAAAAMSSLHANICTFPSPAPVNMDDIIQAANPDLPGTCDVCMEALNGFPACMTACSHVFHVHCLWTWLGNVPMEAGADGSNDCPVCRGRVTHVFPL